MGEIGLGVPSLPTYLLIPVTILTGVLMLFAMVRIRNRPAAFVMGAAWLRYIMSAFHEVTYRPLVAGMSSNALGSIGMVGLGLLTINWRHLAFKLLLPIYAMIIVAGISTIANGPQAISGFITVATKFGYLIVVTLSVFESLRRARRGDFMTAFLWVFVAPLIFQLFSIVLHIAKHTESDQCPTCSDSLSYIGGYHHEAAFSVVLATALLAACFAERLNKYIRNGIVLVCLVGIFFANYRTTIIAITPFLAAYFGFSSLSRFPRRDRPFVSSAIILFGCIAFGLATIVLGDRFQDLGVVATGHTNLLKPPEEFSVDETRVLSGRAHIWSQYIYAWIRGSTINHLFGFGPESWQNVFRLYAHNTLVNNLYEYGFPGVVGALWLWFSMLVAALRVRHPQRGMLVGAHVSFIVLNMSTMPMWMIEGNLLYGLICGYTLYLLSLQRRTPARKEQSGSRSHPALELEQRPGA
ncbi:MAG: O-antigen ligase family protein [Proteobacteria bacterium]|nr:O-antigen ligase family protein [Pseudomonadota bacterium]